MTELGDLVRMVVHLEGRVQGVGFRVFAQREARALGLSGAALNLKDGRVKVVVEGPREACTNLLAVLGGDHAPGAVHSYHHYWTDPEGLLGFTVG
jgi:acylphosphatase